MPSRIRDLSSIAELVCVALIVAGVVVLFGAGVALVAAGVLGWVLLVMHDTTRRPAKGGDE